MYIHQGLTCREVVNVGRSVTMEATKEVEGELNPTLTGPNNFRTEFLRTFENQISLRLCNFRKSAAPALCIFFG